MCMPTEMQYIPQTLVDFHQDTTKSWLREPSYKRIQNEKNKNLPQVDFKFISVSKFSSMSSM